MADWVNTFVDGGDTLNEEVQVKITFEDLNISAKLLKGLYVEMQCHYPSEFQAISLRMILTPPHKDLIAQAHNGSGKSTCFLLGMLSRVDPNLDRTQALCICPTRELAIQNLEVLRKMGKYSEITSEIAISDENAGYMSGHCAPVLAQIVIGTPGTIKTLMSLKKLSVADLKVLVFDEADYMLAEDGFRDVSLHIMKGIETCNTQCQVLLFSALLDETVKNFAAKTLKKDHNQLLWPSFDCVKQYKVTCADDKAKMLVLRDKILEFAELMGRLIIFVNSRRCALSLQYDLRDIGYEVTTIHDARSTDVRDILVKEFQDGLTSIIILHDGFCRGFDCVAVNLVVNFDLPVKHVSPLQPDYEVYLHRIGRAGRFGRKGAVFNLLTGKIEKMIMDKIDQYLGGKIIQVPPSNSDEDFEAAMKAAGLAR